MVWLPAFFPHVLGVYITVKLMQRYLNQQWLIAAIGLMLEGFSCLIIPYCRSFGGVIVPIMIDCFGIALVDTAILPLLGIFLDGSELHIIIIKQFCNFVDRTCMIICNFTPCFLLDAFNSSNHVVNSCMRSVL